MTSGRDAAADGDWEATVSAHKQRRLQRIAAVAFELVGTQGASAVSMSALARAVGVSRPTLYSYVPDVATAVRIHVSAQAELFGDAVRAAVAEESGAPQRLRRYIREQVAYVAGHQHRAVAALAGAGSALHEEGSVAAHRSRQADVLDEILQEGVDDGSLPPMEVTVTATLIGRLLYAADELIHRQGLSPDETVEAITRLVFDGLRAGR